VDKVKYITTPLYYVNAEPHIGHAYTTVAADILARYYRMTGKNVFFLTGTDEHGQKIVEAAAKKNLTPKVHSDKMVDSFKQLWKKLNISNDSFIRTTDKEHEEIVQEILATLYKKKKIEKRKYSGWYCVPDERFWTEKDLAEGNCPDCGRPVEHIEEENYFFLMSEYQQDLIDHIEANSNFIRPETRRNEVLGFLKNNKLEDLCISRPKKRLSWGIPVPFDEEYVTYVWFDALTNYYSATRYLAPDDTVDWWPATCQLIGKDILTTHSVYWSTMLMAFDLKLPEMIFAHGWWLVEDEKMSKSVGNVVDPLDLMDEFGTDAFRFYLFRNSVFGKDAKFSYEGFNKIYECELANELGNLLSRVLSMIEKYKPEYQKIEENKTDDMLSDVIKMNEEGYKKLDFYGVLDRIWGVVRYSNKLIEENKPWELAKNDTEKLSILLAGLFQTLIHISEFIYPFMPETSEKMRQQLGMAHLNDIDIDFSNIKKGDPLFPKKK